MRESIIASPAGGKVPPRRRSMPRSPRSSVDASAAAPAPYTATPPTSATTVHPRPWPAAGRARRARARSSTRTRARAASRPPSVRPSELPEIAAARPVEAPAQEPAETEHVDVGRERRGEGEPGVAHRPHQQQGQHHVDHHREEAHDHRRARIAERVEGLRRDPGRRERGQPHRVAGQRLRGEDRVGRAELAALEEQAHDGPAQEHEPHRRPASPRRRPSAARTRGSRADPTSSPRAACADMLGSAAVASAMPKMPSGNSITRSA